MRVAVLLLVAHFIGDYSLQQHPLFLGKQYHVWIILLHTVIWATVISIALGILGKYKLWKWLFLFAGHTIIDYYKLKFFPHPTPLSISVIDQLLHVTQLYIVSDLYKNQA